MVKADDPSYGVLIDFDSAAYVGESPIEKNNLGHHTMSLAFVARDLLDDFPKSNHEYRHDLESFFYSLWWIAISYRDGLQIKTDILNGWHKDDFEGMIAKKISIRRTLDTKIKFLTSTFSDSPVQHSLYRLTECFVQLFDNDSATPFELYSLFISCLVFV